MLETRELLTEEHRILETRLKRLCAAAGSVMTDDTYRDLVASFLDDVRAHFLNEESAMRTFGCPNFAGHVAEHQALLVELKVWLESSDRGHHARQRLTDQVVTRLRRHREWIDARLDAHLAGEAQAQTA